MVREHGRYLRGHGGSCSSRGGALVAIEPWCEESGAGASMRCHASKPLWRASHRTSTRCVRPINTSSGSRASTGTRRSTAFSSARERGEARLGTWTVLLQGSRPGQHCRVVHPDGEINGEVRAWRGDWGGRGPEPWDVAIVESRGRQGHQPLHAGPMANGPVSYTEGPCAGRNPSAIPPPVRVGRQVPAGPAEAPDMGACRGVRCAGRQAPPCAPGGPFEAVHAAMAPLDITAH